MEVHILDTTQDFNLDTTKDHLHNWFAFKTDMDLLLHEFFECKIKSTRAIINSSTIWFLSCYESLNGFGAVMKLKSQAYKQVKGIRIGMHKNMVEM